MGEHAKLLTMGAHHKALLDSFCTAYGRQLDAPIAYPLGFITNADGSLCECEDCVEHRGKGVYCPLP